MTAVLIITALAAAALVYVLQPLLRGVVSVPAPERESEAAQRKRAALMALLDLEEERDAGKLSAEDHDELRPVYEREALDALKAIDDERAPADTDTLEAEIARVRRSLTCPRCGSLRLSGEACSTCGPR